MQRARVPLGFALAAAFVSYCNPSIGSALTGAAVALVGVSIRLWASGYIEKGRELATTGPYAYTRNPLYLGSMLIGIGFGIASGRPLILACFLLVFASVYLPVMRQEEEELRALFGARFDAYAERVPLLIPRLQRRTDRSNSGPERGFDIRRVLRNREYNSVLGYLAMLVFIWWKIK